MSINNPTRPDSDPQWAFMGYNGGVYIWEGRSLDGLDRYLIHSAFPYKEFALSMAEFNPAADVLVPVRQIGTFPTLDKAAKEAESLTELTKQ